VVSISEHYMQRIAPASHKHSVSLILYEHQLFDLCGVIVDLLIILMRSGIDCS
jgi:hypothetical protein